MIRIKTMPGQDGPVSIVINGWCNHADTIIEERDFGYYSPIENDWVDDWANVELCRRCGAWTDMVGVMEDKWADEHFIEQYDPKQLNLDLMDVPYWEVFPHPDDISVKNKSHFRRGERE